MPYSVCVCGGIEHVILNLQVNNYIDIDRRILTETREIIWNGHIGVFDATNSVPRYVCKGDVLQEGCIRPYAIVAMLPVNKDVIETGGICPDPIIIRHRIGKGRCIFRNTPKSLARTGHIVLHPITLHRCVQLRSTIKWDQEGSLQK